MSYCYYFYFSIIATIIIIITIRIRIIVIVLIITIVNTTIVIITALLSCTWMLADKRLSRGNDAGHRPYVRAQHVRAPAFLNQAQLPAKFTLQLPSCQEEPHGFCQSHTLGLQVHKQYLLCTLKYVNETYFGLFGVWSPWHILPSPTTGFNGSGVALPNSFITPQAQNLRTLEKMEPRSCEVPLWLDIRQV